MSKWISVKDRLPDEGGVYLCYCNGIRHIQVWCKVYDAKRKVFNDSGVTNWMPLPEPPEEE